MHAFGGHYEKSCIIICYANNLRLVCDVESKCKHTVDQYVSACHRYLGKGIVNGGTSFLSKLLF